MRLIHPLTAALLAVPTIGLAQAKMTDQPSTSPATPPGSATTAATAPAAVTVGLPVKDKDGKSVGKVTEVKTDASGKTVAMIKMGADSFGVNASAITVESGAAKLNVSKSELNSYLSKGR